MGQPGGGGVSGGVCGCGGPRTSGKEIHISCEFGCNNGACYFFGYRYRYRWMGGVKLDDGVGGVSDCVKYVEKYCRVGWRGALGPLVIKTHCDQCKTDCMDAGKHPDNIKFEKWLRGSGENT